MSASFSARVAKTQGVFAGGDSELSDWLSVSCSMSTYVRLFFLTVFGFLIIGYLDFERTTEPNHLGDSLLRHRLGIVGGGATELIRHGCK